MKKLSESVWGDIRKKSLGEETRLEDNVNDLDLKGFTQYLKDKYPETATTQTKSSQIRTDGINSIYIPILPWGYNAAYELVYKFERRRLLIHDRYNSNPKLPSKLKFLKKSYVFTTFDSDGESEFFTKQGKPIETNEQVIEIIEMILDNYQGEEDLMISKKISESVWGNIRKKSMGQETRIEDDVNLMDMSGFAEYLKTRYSSTAKITIFESAIYIPLLRNKSDTWYTLVYNSDRLYISDGSHSDFKFPSGLNFLKKDYRFSISMRLAYISTKQDEGRIRNEDVIKFIDRIIDNYKGNDLIICKNVSESVWGSIRKKSLGQETRIEDDINLLDSEGLTDYLKKHYKPLNSFAIITNVGNIISVPIIRNHTNSCIMFSCKTKSVIMTNDIMDQVQGLLRVMENNFSIKTSEGEDGNGEYKVYTILPKDGSEVTNKFFIEVIDSLLYHIPGHLYKKSIMKIDDKA